jgi:hypothetical protein
MTDWITGLALVAACVICVIVALLGFAIIAIWLGPPVITAHPIAPTVERRKAHAYGPRTHSIFCHTSSAGGDRMQRFFLRLESTIL